LPLSDLSQFLKEPALSKNYSDRCIDSRAEKRLGRGSLRQDWVVHVRTGYLLDDELQERQRKCDELNLKIPRFAYRKRLGDFDFTA
jgi:hypothetical protein